MSIVLAPESVDAPEASHLPQSDKAADPGANTSLNLKNLILETKKLSILGVIIPFTTIL